MIYYFGWASMFLSASHLKVYFKKIMTVDSKLVDSYIYLFAVKTFYSS